MDITLQKTITFMLFIGVGLLLKLKFPNKSEITGIKKVILNLALPATIFIALLGIEVKIELLALPLLALVLNFLLYAIFPYILPLLGIPKDSAKFRTARLLIPSLAPGLSCFPFVLEYLGDNALAKAAMADLGNKIFVLIFLYIIAMRWYYAANRIEGTSQGSKIKSLLKSLIAELEKVAGSDRHFLFKYFDRERPHVGVKYGFWVGHEPLHLAKGRWS